MEKTVQCMDCNKTVAYKTKKPKRCKPCKRKHDEASGYVFNRPRPAKQNTNGEIIMFRALDEILKNREYINHGYYSWLMSPKNSPMQLDRYYPGIKLAFEFEGKVHSEYSPYIHGTYEEFEYYNECDRIKKEICHDYGVTLIEVKYNHVITPESMKLDIKKADSGLYHRIFRGEWGK